jgi:cation diffusion facilitator CzcD-associated flavoprotein CzcO
LREKLTPDYPIGCKRVLISNDYYPTLQRDDVSLVTDSVERLAPDGVVTRDGKLRKADVVVYATGFSTTDFLAPIHVVGKAGAVLADVWRDGARAYLGMAVSGFPNLFPLYGPNTNLGHNSIIFRIECQVRYIVQCLGWLARPGAQAVSVKEHAFEQFDSETQQRARRAVWAEACTSWYKTASGRIVNNWPSFTVAYWWQTRRPKEEDFELRG